MIELTLERLGEEKNKAPVHVLQSEAGQIEDQSALIERRCKEQASSLERIHGKLLECCSGLSTGIMEFDVDVECRSVLFVRAVEVSLSGPHLGREAWETFVVNGFSRRNDRLNSETDSPFELIR